MSTYPVRQQMFALCLLFLSLPLHTNCLSGGGETPRLARSVQVDFDNPLNLIIVEVGINGRGPYRFMLDSGSTGSVIDTNLAAEIGIGTGMRHTRRSTSANSRVTASSASEGVQFELHADLQVHLGRVIVAPFSHACREVLGEELHGMIGSEIFFDYVVDVNYAKQTVTFHNSRDYKYLGDGEVLKIHFRSEAEDIPFIHATLVNGARRLGGFPISIDSGGQLTSHASVGSRGDWERLITPQTTVVDALGATGLSNDAEGTTHQAFIAQMERLELGDVSIDEPVVGYSSTGAPFASIGACVLSRFRTIYDYSRKQIILEAGEATADLVDQSGLFLANAKGAGKSFVIWHVSEQSPAAQAGLKRGDELYGIDGVAAQAMSLNQARTLFTAPKTYALEVKRGDQTMTITMTTRSLFDR